jgi:putative membrane protein
MTDWASVPIRPVRSAERDRGNDTAENRIVIDQSPTPTGPRVDLAGNRTRLATLRTKLALDRTTLAWIRTALTMASFGFGMVAFFRSREIESPTSESAWLHHRAVGAGAALLVLGIVAMALAAVSHWIALRKLKRGESPELWLWPLSVTLAMLCAGLGLAGLWALFVR